MRLAQQIPERDELLAKAESIRTVIEGDAERSEAERTLPMTSVNALYDAGLLSMCVPRALGGVEADPLTQTEVYEVVSAMDGSAGWCLVIGATAAGMAGGMLSDRAVEEVFKGGRIPRMSGTVAPSGRAERVDGGYRVTGRWAFGSAIHHAAWVFSSAIVYQNGEPQRLPNGSPQLCSICVPIQDVVIEDTWYANGLKGSGSSHYRLDDVVVPDDFTLGGKNRKGRGGPLYRLPVFGYVAACHAGFALGIAKRAMQEIIALATTKRRTISRVTIGERGAFHKELGVMASRLHGARLLTFETLGEVWTAACAGERLSLEKWGACRAAMTYVTDVAADVTAFAYRYGGGPALYLSHPLQRCFRDIYTATQHGVVSDENYEALGLALLGKGSWDPLISAGD
jgi:alkylation response protein AidB-like acyl-CoA dehydrogenase